MRIISWNTNGLRATAKQGFLTPLFEIHHPDILCLQETKVEADQLPDDVRNIKGYYSYFSHSKNKKGYSGVGIYTKKEPNSVLYGMGIPKFDDEGRVIVAFYDSFVLLNCYFPNGGSGPDRLAYKLEFYDAFLSFIDGLRKKNHSVIFCGDVNTAHEAIDLARPKANEGNTGFLPIERAWMDEVVGAGYVDVFRHFYPTKKDMYTYWDQKTRSRDRNVGWRIDYFFVSSDYIPFVKNTSMLTEYSGSDHCPVVLETKL